MYKALDIAYWFINKYDEYDDEKLSLMKLLKLLYYAEGSHLALYNESLFSEKIIAWEHGPVVPQVYNKFKDNPYDLKVDAKQLKVIATIDAKTQGLLNQVYDIFGKYSASGLRNKTHGETPWREATNNGTVLNKEISRETMKSYFLQHYVDDEA